MIRIVIGIVLILIFIASSAYQLIAQAGDLALFLASLVPGVIGGTLTVREIRSIAPRRRRKPRRSRTSRTPSTSPPTNVALCWSASPARANRRRCAI